MKRTFTNFSLGVSKEQECHGVNVQWPWSEMIACGTKTIETRHYPLPVKHIDMPLALIETPGPKGKELAGIKYARIIAVVWFSGSYRYDSRTRWENDSKHHRVRKDDPDFGFRADKPKWAWVVSKVVRLEKPTKAPSRRGIVFASRCSIWPALLSNNHL